uniref:hypothetical protein n=1 Tax=Thermogutta sp. TaxID=1962930 RepID=UPI003220535A
SAIRASERELQIRDKVLLGSQVSLAGAAVADAAAGGIAASGVSTKVAIHGAHHSFGSLGRLAHIQINWWRSGVKGSGRVLRIPLPWR